MYHRRTAAATLILVIVVLLAPGTARPALDLRRQYEEDLIRWALDVARLEREPNPQGKIIERIEIVREKIIAKSDPWPNFLNWFHITTKDFVVRQELLVKPGQVWDDALVEESARNLRRLPVLAVVRTVACRSRIPGNVILLVVTKDLWSIRLNTVVNAVGSVVHTLDFNPTEMNFLGRNKRLALHVGLRELDLGPFRVRDSIALGERYIDDRVLGTRLQFAQYFDLIFASSLQSGGLNPAGGRWVPSTKAGEVEGFYAALELGRPLYSLATEWGFDLIVSADMRQVRRYVVNPSPPPDGEDPGLSIDTVAIRKVNGTTIQDSYVPWVYDARRFTGSAALTRSYGRSTKHNLTHSIGAYRRRYSAPEGFPFDEDVVGHYLRYSAPWSEDAAYYSFGYNTYSARYVQLRNVSTFALTEDYALGHDVSAVIRFGTDLSAARGFMEGSLNASYTWYFRDNLLLVWLAAGTRVQLGPQEPGYPSPWANTSYGGGFHNVTPRLWIGRLHAQVRAALRNNSLDHVSFMSSLGGDTGLRGYPSNQFLAENLFQANVEYRSLPINLFTLHLGFVVFYDGGAVWGPYPRRVDQDLPFRYYQSVGLGVRGHFPQFDRSSLRVDLGFPLSGEAGGFGTWFSLAFGQVF